MDQDRNPSAVTESCPKRGSGNKRNKQTLTPEQYLEASANLSSHLSRLESGKSVPTRLRGLSKKKMIHAHIGRIERLIREERISINQMIYIINSSFIESGLTPLDTSTVSEYLWGFMAENQTKNAQQPDIDNRQV